MYPPNFSKRVFNDISFLHDVFGTLPVHDGPGSPGFIR